VLLGPAGEFAFVLISAAVAGNVVDARAGKIALVAAALSMLLLPVIARGIAAAAVERRRRARPTEAFVEPPADDNHRVILVGYGRVGTLIGELFDVHKIPFIAIDTDVNVVASARKEGRPAYFGDASRPEFLRRCGIDSARALVVTLNAPRGTANVVDAARKLRPDITIIARARDAEHASELYQLGATDAVPETIEASLQLSEAALVDLGVPIGLVIASIHDKRDEYRKRLVAAGARDRRPQAGRKPRSG